jgi:hypothetical protein
MNLPAGHPLNNLWHEAIQFAAGSGREPKSFACFTLTLTPGERENCFQRLGKSRADFRSTVIRISENGQWLFPLRWGEG